MRPRDMASKWVKILPWYYTERRQPSRGAALRAVLIEARFIDDEPPNCWCSLQRDCDGSSRLVAYWHEADCPIAEWLAEENEA